MRSTFVGDAWVVVFRDQDRNSLFIKSRKEPISRASMPTGAPSLAYRRV
jgi:hypothetical protein